MAVVLGPKGARLDLRLSGSGFDWDDWFTVLEEWGVQGLTTDDAPEYGPALRKTGLDRKQCAVHMQRTVGRHLRDIDNKDLTHLDRALLPILQQLVRERPPEAGTEDRGRSPQLRVPDGPQHGLNRRTESACTEDRPITARHQYQRD